MTYLELECESCGNRRYAGVWLSLVEAVFSSPDCEECGECEWNEDVLHL